ncbi:hypothetical protein PAPHI01_0481 [Pancytospora philotis]|nr:hypothetical protein PAPHI01_0481 [Pancytospora philotis]
MAYTINGARFRRKSVLCTVLALLSFAADMGFVCATAAPISNLRLEGYAVLEKSFINRMRYTPVASQDEYVNECLFFRLDEKRKVRSGEFASECCDFSILLPFIIEAKELSHEGTPDAVIATLIMKPSCFAYFRTGTAHVCRTCLLRLQNCKEMWKHAAGQTLHRVAGKLAMCDDPAVEAECVIGSTRVEEGDVHKLLIAKNFSRQFLVFIPSSKMPQHMMMLSDVYIHEMVPGKNARDDGVMLTGDYMPLVRFSGPLDFGFIPTTEVKFILGDCRAEDLWYYVNQRLVLMNRLIEARDRALVRMHAGMWGVFLTVLDKFGTPLGYDMAKFYMWSMHDENIVADYFECRAARVKEEAPEDCAPQPKRIRAFEPPEEQAPCNRCAGAADMKMSELQLLAKQEYDYHALRTVMIALVCVGIASIFLTYLLTPYFDQYQYKDFC